MIDMENILKDFKYHFIIYFRDKSQVFWASIFPIVLITFFYFAFQGLMQDDLSKVEDMEILVSKDNYINYVLNEIDFIKPIYEEDESSALERLGEKRYIAYIDDEYSLYVKDSGYKQIFLKELVEQFKQNLYLSENVKDYDYKLMTKNYTNIINSKGDSVTIMYYSLIAYIVSFGMYNALKIAIMIQANISNLGARLAASPIKKSSFIFSGILVSFTINLISNFLAYIYIEKVLKLNLITDIHSTIIIIIIGNMLGIGFGLLVGSIGRLKYNEKNLIVTSLPLVLSFLAGMQGPDIRNIVDNKFPLINKINPISIMTELLYKANAIGSIDNFNSLVIKLILFSLILYSLSIHFLRRKTYDSL